MKTIAEKPEDIVKTMAEKPVDVVMTMAEKPEDVVKEEVDQYKVETFDNPIVAYSYEEHHASLVDFFTCLAPGYSVICHAVLSHRSLFPFHC